MPSQNAKVKVTSMVSTTRHTLTKCKVTASRHAVARKVTLTIKTPFSTSVSLVSAEATKEFPYSEDIAFSLR
jgi:hypothetical protein